MQSTAQTQAITRPFTVFGSVPFISMFPHLTPSSPFTCQILSFYLYMHIIMLFGYAGSTYLSEVTEYCYEKARLV